MNMNRRTFSTGLALSALMLTAPQAFAETLEEIEAAARKEGTIVSLGLPDDWANWGGQWKDIMAKYGVTHTDTDMSSAEELAKFEAEKANASADIGEMGLEFGPIAKRKGTSAPYKPTNWDKIPAWARDDDGHWMLGYTGTIAFIVSKKVENPPKAFADLVNGTYKVAVGDVARRLNPTRFSRRPLREAAVKKTSSLRSTSFPTCGTAAPSHDRCKSRQHGKGRNRSGHRGFQCPQLPQSRRQV